jgi:hypothetical protein
MSCRRGLLRIVVDLLIFPFDFGHRPCVWMFDSDANEFVRAEYDPGRWLTELIDELLLVRELHVLRLRVMQLSQRPPWALQRPRQPRS